MKRFSRFISISQHFLWFFSMSLLLSISLQGQAQTNAHSLEFSQAELDQILAPIALYPDTVLSQVLIAATYPIEVVQADRWARSHTLAKGADAVKQVEKKDWDPSVKALVAFPEILQRMSDDVDWTQKLGDAFLSNEGLVMDTIQKLRKKAYTSGSLDKVQHLKVQREADIIMIEPAEERVVYVPVYDTRVVYGNWWWPDYPPIYWHYPSGYTAVSGFYWGSSVSVGSGYFYSSCHWRERHVVVVEQYDHHYPRPTFYTGRSIVGYEGAREWRHEPVHRRGVAYYNNQLRDDYGSRHESYRDARTYREQYRNNADEPRNTTSPRQQNRFDERHPSRANLPQRSDGISFGAPAGTIDSNRHVIDRSEQLRERMNRSGERNERLERPAGAVDRTISPSTISTNANSNERINTKNLDATDVGTLERKLNIQQAIENNQQNDMRTGSDLSGSSHTERRFNRDSGNAENTTNINTNSHADDEARMNNRFQRDMNTTPHNEVPVDRTFNRHTNDENTMTRRMDTQPAEQPRPELRQEPRQEPREVREPREQRQEPRQEPQGQRQERGGSGEGQQNRFRRDM